MILADSCWTWDMWSLCQMVSKATQHMILGSRPVLLPQQYTDITWDFHQKYKFADVAVETDFSLTTWTHHGSRNASNKVLLLTTFLLFPLLVGVFSGFKNIPCVWCGISLVGNRRRGAFSRNCQRLFTSLLSPWSMTCSSGLMTVTVWNHFQSPLRNNVTMLKMFPLLYSSTFYQMAFGFVFSERVQCSAQY